MKIPFRRCLCLVLTAAMFSSGCTSFKPNRMEFYESEDYPKQAESNNLIVGARPLTREQIQYYFHSDLAKKNIWPVPVIIENKGKESYVFSKGMIEPAVTDSHTVARKGRRSAGHRLFWGTLLILTFFGIPIGVPMVVGGIQALDANSSMETDYKIKEILDREIKPGEKVQGVIYFHSPQIPSDVKVNLLEKETDRPLQVVVNLQ